MKVGFIGSGNMGSALAIAAKKSGADVYLYDKSIETAKSLAQKISASTLPSAKDIARECDFIFLAVKPNIIPSVAEEIRDTLLSRGDAVVVSMAAGTSIARIEAILTDGVKIIRIMPNTPAQIGKGMILWCANTAVSEVDTTNFLSVMEYAGALDNINEKLIDAASALSGCGPAFVYMFIEALSDGAVECGLSREKAQSYAIETVIGAAELLRESGKHPGELKDAVCSPGGSTISGVLSLEDNGFRSAASGAVVASYKKTLSMGK